jgi:signal peptidase I
MSSKKTESSADRSFGSQIRFILLLALGVWVLRSLIVAPFSISSGSMLPTMAIGDYLFVAKWPYGFSRYSFPLQFPPVDGRVLGKLPERGDIVVFKKPGETTDWVKRVIGLPGEVIAVEEGRVLVNGQPIARSDEGLASIAVSPNSPCRVVPGATANVIESEGQTQCRYPVYRERLANGRNWLVIDQADDLRADHFGPVRVPAGHVFLMGDNRDDSMDSRYSPAEGGIGPVPVEYIVGKATFAFWSSDGSASYWLPWTWFSALRPERIGEDYRP